MITKKRFHNIEELQKIQALANRSRESVGLHSEDSSVIVDAKSFIGLFALDFFAEEVPSEELLEQTKRIVIYRWNRHYPADIRWEPDLAAMGFVLKETAEFPGTSHEKITREVYER